MVKLRPKTYKNGPPCNFSYAIVMIHNNIWQSVCLKVYRLAGLTLMLTISMLTTNKAPAFRKLRPHGLLPWFAPIDLNGELPSPDSLKSPRFRQLRARPNFMKVGLCSFEKCFFLFFLFLLLKWRLTHKCCRDIYILEMGIEPNSNRTRTHILGRTEPN